MYLPYMCGKGLYPAETSTHNSSGMVLLPLFIYLFLPPAAEILQWMLSGRITLLNRCSQEKWEPQMPWMDGMDLKGDVKASTLS